ncbi:MAG: NUDIX hydrolase [Anaerolineales bacterium]|jgi:ADP-ribose pyrophosphatase
MPFSILNLEKQYKGHAFDVAKVHIQLPNGQERDYDLVQHAGSVTIMPIDENNQVYFVIQHRIGANKKLIELPAGVLDAGEEPRLCAQREIREEIGMDAKQIRALGSFYLAPGYSDEYMTVFLATDLFPSPLNPDADEFLEVVTMPIDEVYRKAQSGAFYDGKTLAALLLAQPKIKDRLEVNLSLG